VDVQRLHKAGTSSVVPLSVPDLDIAKTVQVSNTGAIMVQSESGIRVLYYL
jgi:phospholipase/lecithinase/hemolysin